LADDFLAVWLKFWTDANAEEPNQRAGYYIGVYAAFQVLGVMSNALLIWYGWLSVLRKCTDTDDDGGSRFVLVVIAARTGISLHERLLTTVMRYALMSLC
jgi:ATP-binding cassette, subfamily C (CFTR/MRP), member 1